MSDFFYELTPEQILNAVEQAGMRSTGRCYALNSLENRVYEVEMEDGSKVVGKFYRPGRWSRQQILEEHEFLKDLREAEVPAVAPLPLQNGATLAETESGIFFTVFPKMQGRAPEELDETQLMMLGRFVARLHNVGVQREAPHRLKINPETYGTQSLKLLSDGGWLPLECSTRYLNVAREIIKTIAPWFENLAVHRIHGDCHLGNLLFNKEGGFFIDFDDMVTGPAVQDMWLMIPGQDEKTTEDRNTFLRGYTEMRDFDRSTLRLIEPLRCLRIINYSAWIARRWEDPAFKRIFPEFNTHKYWESEILALQKCMQYL